MGPDSDGKQSFPAAQLLVMAAAHGQFVAEPAATAATAEIQTFFL
jgi:hypothetical protein